LLLPPSPPLPLPLSLPLVPALLAWREAALAGAAASALLAP